MPAVVARVPDFNTGFLRFCVKTMPEFSDCSGLLIGQMQPTGTATPNEITVVNSATQAADLFGGDSVIAKMVQMFICQCGGSLDADTALFVLPVEDDPGATAPEYTLTISGTATEFGTYVLEIPCGVNNVLGNIQNLNNGNCYYETFVNNGDTAATIAANLAAVINADPNAFFTATDDGSGVITLVAKHGGTALNGILPDKEPYLNYRLPSGLICAWAQTVTGATDPDISTAMGNLGTCCYDCWALGFDDPAARDILFQEMENRWSCEGDNCFGHSFTYLKGEVNDMITIAEPTDFAVTTYVPVPAEYKYPGFMLTAAWAGRNCCHVCTTEDPGRPAVRENGILSCLCDVDLCGAGPWSRDELELMAQAGIAGWEFSRDGTIQIVNNITNYKRNQFGQADTTWTQVTSRYVLAEIVDRLRDFYMTYYQSHKLVNNGVEFDENRRVTSPAHFKGHLIGWLNGQQDDLATGIIAELVDDDDVADNIVVSRNDRDCNRLDVGFKANLIQPLLRIGTCIDVQPCRTAA